MADLITGPPEETPGWHAGELETSTTMAYMKDKGIYEGSVFMEHSEIFQTSILTTPKKGI